MKYFDKSFLKFTIGFLGIISVSLFVIIATAVYSDNSKGSEVKTNTLKVK